MPGEKKFAMKKTIYLQDQNFWYLPRPDVLSLNADKATESCRSW